MWARTLIAAAVLLSSIVNPVHGAFCTPEKQCWPKDATLERWANSLTSPNTTITTPETPGFLGVALVMNELKSNFPAMVVAPGNEADLVSTVKMAAKHRIRLVARCSGHDYNDRSTGRGIIQLNTQLLKSIEYDPVSTDMTIAAGCNFLEIYKFAEGINRAVVGGQSATVCLAGYLMGGGHSNLSPVYGLGIDNVISIRFALYNGTVLTLTPTDNADLFNALLGSGANTYGVLISVRYKTYPAAPYVTAISGIWMSPMKLGDPSVLDYIFNLTWYLAKPNNLVAPYVTFGTEGNNYTSIKFYISNPDYQAALDYLDPLFALPSFVRMDGTNYSSIYEYSLAIYGSKGDTGQIWQRKFLSNVMLPLDQELLDRAKAVTIEQQSQTGFKLLLVHGGVSMEGTAGAVPRGLRQSLGELAFGDQWDDPNEDIFRIKRISDVMDKLKFVNATYVNEYTTFYGIYNVLDDWRTRFYSNYTHLLEVKAKYDPCNLYVVEYGVGSDMRRAVCGL